MKTRYQYIASDRGLSTVAQPTLPTLLVRDFTVTEGGEALFIIGSTAVMTDANTIQLTLGDGTATAPSDFLTTGLQISTDGVNFQPFTNGGNASIAPGKDCIYLKVQTVDDDLVEAGSETFVLTATPVAGFGGGAVIETATIADNDVVRPPTIGGVTIESITDPTVTEGEKAVFTVQLGGELGGTKTVGLTLKDDDAVLDRDYRGGIEASFDDGQSWQAVSSSSLSVASNVGQFKLRVETIDNSLEDFERFFNLRATVDGDFYDSTVKILDNDSSVTPPVTPTPPTPPAALTAKLVGDLNLQEGGIAGSYRVELSDASDQDRLFTITIGDGTANRIDAAKGTVLGPATMTRFTGNGQGTLETQQVAKSFEQWGDSYWRNVNTAGNGYQVTDDKDFTLTKSDGALNSGNTIVVKVPAGQKVSEEFKVNAWQENVIAPWALSPAQLATNESFFNWYGQESTYVGTGRNSAEAQKVQEGEEKFTLKITDAGGVALNGDQLEVKIADTSKVLYISPIALDLNGDGIQTIAVENGVLFDMLNRGEAVQTGWISGGDAFLAFDQNQNGIIDNRDELFGGGVGEGFAELATFDSNGDGLVDSSDALFDSLKLWQDSNVNGVTDTGELASLSAYSVSGLNVNYTNQPTLDAQGNILGERSTAIASDGAAIEMVDVYFKLG